MTTRFPLVVVVLLLASSVASAQGTYTDGVARDSRRQYSFTTFNGGQFIATLSWDNEPANLLMLLVCGPSNGSAEPLTFGVAAAGLNRTARMEAGVLPRSTCIISVSSIDEPASFRLNLQMSSDQLATPRTALLASPVRDAAVDAKLRAHVDVSLRALEAAMR